MFQQIAVDVIEVAPVTTPASTLIVPSNKIADPAAGSRLIAPPESNVIVVPTASQVPSAVSVMFAAAAAASVVVIANVPLVPTVNVAVSLDDPVMVTTLPSMATSSTVNAVKVPRLVMFVCAAVVTVAAVPDTSPVTSPVKSPVIAPVEVRVSTYAFLNLNRFVPKSTSLSAVGLSTPSANIN